MLDGGGSSLKVFLQSESGVKLKAKYKGNFNVQTGEREKILHVIRVAIQRFPSESVKIGLAGVVSKKDGAWFVSNLVGKKISVMSDVDLALDLHFQNGDGMMAILGTGSIFAAKIGNKKIKIGGYGRVIGDAGSGYAIGREAVREYLQLLDGFARDPVFETAMKKFFRTKEDAVRKIYQKKFELQHLAPVVFNCAAQGSTIAMNIIDHQTSLVVRYIEALRRRVGRDLPLHLIGGLLEHETQYTIRLKEKLNRLNINSHHHYGSS
ncbi:MAG: BadF/BadG/BcrA/BcrD ATPase family protein [Chloroherpetonaceae bacterium]